METLAELLIRQQTERLKFAKEALAEVDYIRSVFGEINDQPPEAKKYFYDRWGIKREQEMNHRHMDELYSHPEIFNNKMGPIYLVSRYFWES